MKLHISDGNSKVGRIPNTSFPPGATCRADAPCFTSGECYAIKFYRMYKECRKAWDENLAYYKADPAGYWTDLERTFATARQFRYFVSGDIPDAEYFKRMVEAARAFPKCDFLAFTKQFETVNAVMDEMDDKTIPDNLHLLFSQWEGLEVPNPYRFPTTAVIRYGQTVWPDDWKICGGNCSDCVCKGTGCWTLKPGETIAFHQH